MRALLLVWLWLLPTGAAIGAGPERPLHPTFPPLDEAGIPVRDSGRPLSAQATCGACHDAGWIDLHTVHPPDRVAADCVTCHVKGGAIVRDADSFDSEGRLLPGVAVIAPPGPDVCGRCHGLVQPAAGPLVIPDDFAAARAGGPAGRPELTRRSGAIISPHSIADTPLNVAGRDRLDRPWDVHAARMVGCTACHAAANNPGARSVRGEALPHLRRDPRQPRTADYLRRPDHRLNAPACTDCHDPDRTHRAVVRRHRHLASLACQACHVPELYGPVFMSQDETLALAPGTPALSCRNADCTDDPRPFNIRYLEPFVPPLLARAGKPIGPHNVIARWYWIDGAPDRPVGFDLVERASLELARPAGWLLTALDRNQDGTIGAAEAALGTPELVAEMAGRLRALGVVEPRIAGSVDHHPVAHGIATGRWVRFECLDCHAGGGRLDTPVVLAATGPHAVLPKPRPDGPLSGADARRDPDGRLTIAPPSASLPYIPGLSRDGWSDPLGFALFCLTAAGAALHAGLRIITRRRRTGHVSPDGPRAYFYTAYERLWHWLMAASVITLMATGFAIHFPRLLPFPGFRNAIAIHDFVAAVLLANALFALLYHLASNQIRQFIPRRVNLLAEIAAQARFYASGIFLGAPHPVGRSPQRKLNPLQQITYLGLLNVLFPLQAVTGMLMWGVAFSDRLDAALGGLSLVAPLHTFGSWLFLSFLIAHIYLSTTGRTPLSHLRAMAAGWDEAEPHPPAGAGAHGADNGRG